MRIGLALPHYDFSAPDGAPVSWERLAGSATRAEALGFDSAWVSDHFFLSLARYGGPDEPFGSAEPLTTLAGLATVTERLRLGTLVLSAGFRHPALLAKAATTIDLLSGGRLDLGIGAGWYEDEYRAFGYELGSVDHRFEVLEETLEVLGLLFAGGPADHEGKHFRLHDAWNQPVPVQKPRPPLWVGGKGGPRLRRLIARHADGWNTVWAWTPGEYGKRAAALRQDCERERRDMARLSVGLYTLVGEDEADVAARFGRWQERWPALDGMSVEEWGTDKLVGTPEQVVARMAEFAAHGVEEIIVGPGAVPFAADDGSMLDLIAEQVIPAARDLS